MAIKKANKVYDISGAVYERALSMDEIDIFYRNTTIARGGRNARTLLNIIINQCSDQGRNAHILFVGYRGCGKSTELNHLQKDIQNEFAVLNYSVMKELDPQSIEYIELFIVAMEKLFLMITKMNLSIEEAFLNKITDWTKTKEITEIKDRHFSIEAETGTNTKAVIPYLHEFFLKLKGTAKASKSFKETIKETLEPRLADLIMHCNDLISEVRIQLVAKGYKDLIIIIEDLDKIPLPNAQKIFFEYANQLTQLKTTVVYTFPVTLYYNIRFGSVKSYFAGVIELPMIKTRFKDGSISQVGIDVLREIVLARIDRALFASEDLLLKFITITGGVIRDLFILLQNAAFEALLTESTVINEEHYLSAYRQMKKEYSNTIAEYTDENGTKFRPDDFYNELVALINNKDKQPEHTEITMLLRQNLCMLSYNGEGWCDVHPIVKDILRERRKID